MKPGDQLVCVFTDNLAEGTRFDDWLPHVTLVPWYTLLIPREDFAELMAGQLHAVEAFAAKVGPEEKFGLKRANILRKNQWRELHAAALNLINQAAKKRVPYKFTGRFFSPHISVQKSGRAQEGDIFWVDRVYIVEKVGIKTKEVVSIINLAKKPDAA